MSSLRIFIDTADVLSKDPTRKHVVDQLSDKLQAFYDSRVQESLHRKAECEDLVYNVVHKIIRKVQTVDSRFRANSLVSLGMPYDGIHGDELTDFEIMLQLSMGSNNSLFLHRYKNGLTTRIQPISGNVWEDCIESNSNCISPKHVTCLLRQYVKRSVYVLRKYIDGRRTDKLPEHLTSLELEGDKNRIYLRINKNIRVRVLPSVSIPDCRTDMSRKDNPSSSHVVAVCQQQPPTFPKKDENENIVEIILDENNNKCILSPDNNNNTSAREQEKNTRVVWKFSFFVAEKNKMRTIIEGCRIKLLRILTEIRDNDLRLHALTPYHLQTMFFHETDRLHRRREWKDTKIASRFLDILRTVSAHLENGVCMNYFMQPPNYPAVNLFEDISRAELQQMKEVVNGILEKPLDVLLVCEPNVEQQGVKETDEGGIGNKGVGEVLQNGSVDDKNRRENDSQNECLT